MSVNMPLARTVSRLLFHDVRIRDACTFARTNLIWNLIVFLVYVCKRAARTYRFPASVGLAQAHPN